MNNHRAGTRTGMLALAAALAVGLLTACGSGDEGSGPAGPDPTVVDRTDPAQVADGFVTAYAAGDFSGACVLAGAELQAKLQGQGQCSGQAGWNETVTRQGHCTSDDGRYAVLYEASGHVDRFLILSVFLTEADGQWSATGFVKDSPGRMAKDRLRCDTVTLDSTPEGS